MTVPSVTPSGCQVRESVWARVCVWMLLWMCRFVRASVYARTSVCAHAVY